MQNRMIIPEANQRIASRQECCENKFVDPEFLSNCRVFSRWQQPLKMNSGVTGISARVSRLPIVRERDL